MTPQPQHDVTAMSGAPRPLTSFVGRSAERHDLGALLQELRLVTVTGPGGSGKTRLLLVVVEATQGQRHWVPLAALDSPELVAPTVARALGLSDADRRTAVDEIASAVADDPLLLVLDTCEHVADAVAELVEELLLRCPGLRVATTSRAPLRVPGELLWPIPPLAFPDDLSSTLSATPEGNPELGDAPFPDAVELFVQRARAVRPDLDVRGGALHTIAAICRRLDGNPLAIELSAARAQVLPVHQINAALDDALRLLVSTTRSAPVRQQTLRATLDWSHRLLSPREAELFRRLAVFAGGATLEAVAAVCDPGSSPVATLDLLGALVDRSLLRVSLTAGYARYSLAEPVRQYAEERLRESGEEPACSDRHLRWFFARVEGADQLPTGAEQSAAYAELERELPNLRSAFAEARSQADWRRELQLATGAASFAMDHGHHREGRSWLDHALAHAAAHDAQTRLPDRWAAALKAAGVLAFLQCDYPVAVSRLESARATYDELGDSAGAASASQSICGVVREQGDYVRAEELVTASLAYWRSVGDDESALGALLRLAFTVLLWGDHARATSLATDGLATAWRLDDPVASVAALIILGDAALAEGDIGAATGYLESAHAGAVEHQLPESVGYTEEGFGLLALRRNDVGRALGHLQSSLRRQHELGDRWRTASLLVELATCRRLLGDSRAAAWLLGASQMLLEQIGGQLPPLEWPERDRTIAAVTADLSTDDRDAAWMSGRCAPLATTVAAALAEPGPASRPADASTRPAAPVPSPVSEPGLAASLTHLALVRPDPAADPAVPADVAYVSGLTLQTLGQEAVQLSGRALSRGDFSYAKPRELLFFLADAGEVDKAQIGLALWPEASATELRSAFHTTLHHLRKAVGAERVRFEHGRYRLERDGLDYDVEAFTSALATARRAPTKTDELKRLQRATALYAGDYLATSSPPWSERTRDELRDRQLRALLALGRMLSTGGGHVAAVDAFRRVLALDPLSESAHRELMRSYEALGEPSRAHRQYEQLTGLLRDELGARPADCTVDLYERIRSR